MYRYLFATALAISTGVWAADTSVSGRVSVQDGNKSIDVSFSSGDRTLIQNYYRTAKVEKEKGGKGKKVPPGLAKKGGLPPGIAKRQRLPDNIAYEPLPRELEAKLPPLPSPNYVRVKIGQDFAILDKKTRVVLDMAFGLGD